MKQLLPLIFAGVIVGCFSETVRTSGHPGVCLPEPFTLKVAVTDGTEISLTKFNRYIVTAFDEQGDEIRNPEIFVEGRHVFQSNRTVAYLRITPNGEEDFCMVKDGPWSRDAKIDIDLTDGSLFTLSGTFTSEINDSKDGARIAAIDSKGRLIAEKGVASGHAFGFRTNREIACLHVTAACVGLRVAGPWNGNAVRDINLSRERFGGFALEGTVTTEKGWRPSNLGVTAYDESGDEIAHVGTVDGRYRIRTNREVAYLKARIYDGGDNVTRYLEIFRDGPWGRDATVDIDFAHEKIITIQGRVIGEAGQSPKQTNIFVFDRKNRFLTETEASRDGSFRFRTNREVAWLYVYGYISGAGFGIMAAGPWNQSTIRNIDLGRELPYMLEGVVTNKDGSLVERASMHAYLISGAPFSAIMHTFADDHGHFEFRTNMPASHITALGYCAHGIAFGPWNGHASVRIVIQGL